MKQEHLNVLQSQQGYLSTERQVLTQTDFRKIVPCALSLTGMSMLTKDLEDIVNYTFKEYDFHPKVNQVPELPSKTPALICPSLLVSLHRITSF